MDYKSELQRINDKYYSKIKNTYGKYIKNFDKIPDMTQDVFLLSDEECIDSYADLAKGKNRGRCDADTGKIYIRKDAFTEHLLVHEFIHRLSINFDGKQWVLGIDYSFSYLDYTGINELITEWIAYSITNCREETAYQKLFFIMEFIYKKYVFSYKKVLKAYFTGDIKYIHKFINNKFQKKTKSILFLEDINDYIEFNDLTISQRLEDFINNSN